MRNSQKVNIAEKQAECPRFSPRAEGGETMILTQQKLIYKLRDYGIRASSQRIHAWVRAECPTVPGGKKPRFILAHMLEWLQSGPKPDPLEQEVRDCLYKRSRKRSA
jgi:hypothetical protein